MTSSYDGATKASIANTSPRPVTPRHEDPMIHASQRSRSATARHATRCRRSRVAVGDNGEPTCREIPADHQQRRQRSPWAIWANVGQQTRVGWGTRALLKHTRIFEGQTPSGPTVPINCGNSGSTGRLHRWRPHQPGRLLREWAGAGGRRRTGPVRNEPGLGVLASGHTRGRRTLCRRRG